MRRGSKVDVIVVVFVVVVIIVVVVLIVVVIIVYQGLNYFKKSLVHIDFQVLCVVQNSCLKVASGTTCPSQKIVVPGNGTTPVLFTIFTDNTTL